MIKVGSVVIEKKYGYRGIVEIQYDNWDDLKAKSRFLSIDPDDEANEMDYAEKLINGDPRDEWLRVQNKPFTNEQLNEKWYSIRCFDGGAIWSCESELELLNEMLN